MGKAQGYKHAAPPEQRQVSQICYLPEKGLTREKPFQGLIAI